MQELSSKPATVIHLTHGRSTTVTSSDFNKTRQLESRVQQQSELIALMKKRSDDLIHQVLLRLEYLDYEDNDFSFHGTLYTQVTEFNNTYKD